MRNISLAILYFIFFTPILNAQTHTTHLLSYTTLSLEIADLDDDGDQDFLTGGISNLQWQENNGTGVFTSHTITQNFDETHAFKVIDFDGDGDKDIVASSFTTNQIVWLENDGDQNFTLNSISTAAGGCAGLDVIDFDNDGDQDVVATGYNSDEVFWLQNNGSQVFTKNVIRGNFNGAASIRVFDVDTDGDKDIVTSGILCDSIILLRNNGGQTFLQQFLHPLDGPRSLRLVDFDNDGDTDITFAGDGGLGWILNASGILTVNQYSPTYTRDFYVVDLNNDNFKDLVFTNYADDYISWQKNNGNQTYTGMGYIDSFINSPVAVGAADFTGDGFKEVIGVSNQEVKFCTNNAGLSFTKKALNYYMYTVKSACHGDFDNDGDVDLMAVGYFNVYFYRNDGNNQFTTIKVFSTNNSFGGEEIRAVDMDGDGDTDVVYTEGVGNRISWLENQGAGNFVYRLVYSLIDPKGVHCIDYDFDGDMDVVAATVETFSLSAIYWYENNGSEVFTEHLVNGSYAFPNGIFALDWDSDNYMDVAAAYSGTGGSQKVILHDGQNGWNITVNNNSQGASSVYAIDMDNDGDMDILSSGFNDYDIIWYENPNYTPHTIDGNAQGATHVFAGDMDGDGDIDVASTSSTDDKVSWYENNGNQSFTKKSLASNVPYPESIEGGDIDGDGIMELYSVCKESHSVAIYYKVPAPPPPVLTTCGDLFISEYIEGSSNNKAIEIYNPTSSTIDLSNYSIGVYSNGATSPSQTATLAGTIASNGVYVITHPSAVAAILNNADQTFGFNFNGDDAIGLLKSGQLIDIVGKIGEDPGTEWSSGGVSTLDKTLVRKSTVSKGSNLNINFVADTEWDVFLIDDATHLNAHISQCANYCPPSLSITATSTNICAGASVTFATNATNQGTSPVYQWKKNGNNVATGTSYTTSTLTNNDVITCELTSSLACAIDPITSNSITITVSPSVTPSINISASATTICSGTNINFTANATNGGSAPTYVWKKNGNTVGTNASTYSSNALVNGDVITCIFTSNAGCVTANNITSNSITINVNPSVTPSITISTNNTTICAGTSITFTSTPANGGTTPGYQWYKNNNIIAGATSANYTTSTAINGDVFKCVLTSNALCATTSSATSNNIAITVNPLPVASTISAGGPTTFCSGGYAVLSGNNNGGTWSNGETTASITVTTSGSYYVINSNSCGSINSNSINITANPLPTASTISASGATTFCAGS
ncbi:MAG TPA: FG-GAP-like repeat-containing protein, partial [Bacteroidia bacterium]|nr:FG-GAP-like repeat-containing protein [Bacteroidia bacterium]